jgi:uncharacterized protein (TIGR02594 family)
MPEYEELRLTVSLIDNASQGLATLQKNLREVGGSEQRENLVKMQKEVTNLHGQMGKFREEMGLVEKTAYRFGSAIRGQVAGFASAFVGSFALGQLRKFADEMIYLGGAARSVGIQGGTLKNIVDQMKGMGVDAGSATSFVKSFTGALAGLSREGNALRIQLMQGAKSDPEAMKAWIGRMTGFSNKGQTEEAINEFVEGLHNLVENEFKRTGSRPMAQALEHKLLEGFGADPTMIALIKDRLRQVTQAQQEVFDAQEKNAREFTKELTKTDKIYEEFVRGLQGPLLSVIREINAAIGEMGEGWGKAFGAEVVADIKLIGDAIKPVYDAVKWIKDNSNLAKPATVPNPNEGLGLHPSLQRTFGITPSKENIENWKALREQGSNQGDFWDWFSPDLFKGKNFKDEIFSKEPSNAVRGSMLSSFMRGHGGVTDFGGAAKGMGIPDWMSSVSGGLFKAARVPGDAMKGKYTRKPEIEGQWSENDDYWQDQLNKQKIHDAFGIAGYGAQATSSSLLRNLVPESLPGALKKNADMPDSVAEPLPTVQEINRRRAMRRGGFQRMSFGGGGGDDEAFSRSAGSSMAEFTRAIRTGVFEGMVDFKDYLAGTKLGGGGAGFQNASLTTGGAGDNTPIGAAFRNASLGGTGGGGFQMPGGANIPSNISIPGESGGVGGGRLGSGGSAPHGSDVGPGTGKGAGDTPAGQPGGGGGGDLDRGAYDKMFKGTPLEGQYDKVVEAAQANGVPPSTMAAIIAHETGQGTSKMLRERNNPAGLMDPKTGMMKGQSFASIGEGIDAAGRTIGKNYRRGGGTIGGMAGIYAPPGAANDPGGLNQGWAGGVNKFQNQLQSRDAPHGSDVGPGTGTGAGDARRPGGSASGASPPGAGGGEMGPSQALAYARQHLGEDEIRDQGKLQSFFRSKNININPATTAWCAAFVNANLAEAGIKGTGSLAAGSFTKYGTAVKPGEVQPGDIGVVRGTSSRTGVEGQHVGFLTGESRTNPRTGALEYKMLGGNQGGTASGQGGVSEQWRSASSLHLRRPPSPTGQPVSGEGRAGLDRDMGREITSRVHGTGKLSVDVKAPAGTKVDASGQGLFSKVEMDRQTQMEPARSGPPVSTPREPEQLSI